ncbi:MAG: hypothetical protein ACOYKE_03880 [Ferruginibacter sp.]
MTFLEALYGGQHHEIAQQGKDGNKGRLNGNIFLAVMVFLVILIVFILLNKLDPSMGRSFQRMLRKTFGHSSGRTMGKLIALPLFFIIYVIINYTIGSAQRYAKTVAAFNELPELEKKQANKKLLLPFFVLLFTLVILMITSL